MDKDVGLAVDVAMLRLMLDHYTRMLVTLTNKKTHTWLFREIVLGELARRIT